MKTGSEKLRMSPEQRLYIDIQTVYEKVSHRLTALYNECKFPEENQSVFSSVEKAFGDLAIFMPPLTQSTLKIGTMGLLLSHLRDNKLSYDQKNAFLKKLKAVDRALSFIDFKRAAKGLLQAVIPRQITR